MKWLNVADDFIPKRFAAILLHENKLSSLDFVSYEIIND